MVAPRHDDTPMREAAAVPGPVVSVIMIFLNAERFIAEAIESVLTQTYRNWELLLVDDGSSDGSSAIAKAHAERSAGRVRYLEHDGHVRRGTGASRNAGMAAARGEYIAFLDSDDVYTADRLARHVAAFESFAPVDIVISGELYWWSWQAAEAGASRRAADRVFVPPLTPRSVFQPPDLLTIMLESAGAATPSICSISFRSSLFRAVGGVPDGFSGLYEDQALISKLLLYGRAVVLDECLARYRQHAASLTHSAQVRGEYRPGRAHAAEAAYLDSLDTVVALSGRATPRLTAALTRRRRQYDQVRVEWLHDTAAATRSVWRELLRASAGLLLSPAKIEQIAARRAARRARREAERVRSIERSVMAERAEQR